MRTIHSIRSLDLGTQRIASTTPSSRGVLGRWRLAGLLGVFGTTAAATTLSGCVSDPDCGICDPDNLIIESIAGVNYAGKIVKLLGPECIGDECPEEIKSGKYFVEKVIPCLETDAAIEAGRGSDEWCRVSPLVVDSGIQFIFNNLLDPTSVELVRKQPVNPQLFETFDWKTHIVHLEGPVTRFNGDYLAGATQTKPDQITRSVNLACIDNLGKQGQAFDHTVLDNNPAICDGTYKAEDGKVWPLKAELQRKAADGQLKPTTVDTYDSELDVRSTANSCTPPQSGADSCCDACDYEVAVNVSKYGVTQPVDEMSWPGDLRRTDQSGITCDPMGDKFKQCVDFVPHVYRANEVRSFEYDWQGARTRFHVPLHDKLRETHPNDRPKGLEQATVPCETDEDCTAETKGKLIGTECVGTDGSGKACNKGDDCENKRCLAEWFGDCRADAATTGEGGYCIDKRWSGQGAAGCFTATKPFYICANTETCAEENFGSSSRTQKGNSRIALADANTDGVLSAVEGCRASLGGPDGTACDPLFQPAVSPVPRYDRKDTLPSSTRSCVCEDEPAPGCKEFVDQLCRVDGDANKPIVAAKQGQYAIKFVRRNGGVIYDPALKGVQFLPADLGNVPRSFVEACSQGRKKSGGSPLIGTLNIKDGWRANDSATESFENFDRAMCSSAEYKVVFATPPADGQSAMEYIRDKVGNTLQGKSNYVLHTPDFHVVPGSGFPTDNLRIGACDDFELRFSNKYDLGDANLKKLQIVRLSADGKQELEVVAGGLDCATEKGAGVPCLTTNVRDQEIGSIRVAIDTRIFGADVLVAGQRYRLKVPGLTLAPGETVHDVIAKDPVRYGEAFWDACGMPLVTAMPLLDSEGKASKSGEARAPDYLYDFNIDEPKPKEDVDNDNVQFSCDNAPKNFNPDQEDMDGDGFGDIIDLCPTVATESNSSDTDKDGIGNVCDRCSRQLTAYNKNAGAAGAPVSMMVRNIPVQDDFDKDGIGDVCDNCIAVANCADFGATEGLTPAGISTAVPDDKDNVCQTDNDMMFPFIGDACVVEGEPLKLPDAAGPVGHASTDDFDQDGLTNADDFCPRIRVERVVCDGDNPCADGAVCTAGICNHVDTDLDSVGDRCDTCPATKNPGQVQDGGMQTDDPDGDFVGNQCETSTGCYDSADSRRIAFYSQVSPGGQCCVTTFTPELKLSDPGYVTIDEVTGTCNVADPVLPITADCPEAQEDVSCRKLPKSVVERPGVVTLPAGCAGAGEVLTLDSPEINGDENKLYKSMCLMPQLDQDFDGIGDACDLCPYAFDPDNSFYKDENNKVYPNAGKFCRGAYEPDNVIPTCADVGGDTDTDTDTDGGSGGGGGSSGA